MAQRLAVLKKLVKFFASHERVVAKDFVNEVLKLVRLNTPPGVDKNSAARGGDASKRSSDFAGLAVPLIV
jgi:hypothetical protein